MSAPVMNINAPPSESELNQLSAFLVQLPFAMRNLGHKTIEGHSVYVSGQEGLVAATLNWLSRQSPANWDSLIAAWGGEDQFQAIQGAVLSEALKQMMGAMR